MTSTSVSASTSSSSNTTTSTRVAAAGDSRSRGRSDDSSRRQRRHRENVEVVERRVDATILLSAAEGTHGRARGEGGRSTGNQGAVLTRQKEGTVVGEDDSASKSSRERHSSHRQRSTSSRRHQSSNRLGRHRSSRKGRTESGPFSAPTTNGSRIEAVAILPSPPTRGRPPLPRPRVVPLTSADGGGDLGDMTKRSQSSSASSRRRLEVGRQFRDAFQGTPLRLGPLTGAALGSGQYSPPGSRCTLDSSRGNCSSRGPCSRSPLCMALWELCHPARTVIDQNEVEILPPSSSSGRSTRRPPQSPAPADRRPGVSCPPAAARRFSITQRRSSESAASSSRGRNGTNG